MTKGTAQAARLIEEQKNDALLNEGVPAIRAAWEAILAVELESIERVLSNARAATNHL